MELWAFRRAWQARSEPFLDQLGSAQQRTRLGLGFAPFHLRDRICHDAGGRLASTADGAQFRRIALKQPVAVTGLVEIGNGRYAIVGPRGVGVAETTAP